MLQTLRKGAGTWVAKGLMFLLVASFGLWGVADYLRIFRDAPVAKVGSAEITKQEYAFAVRQSVKRLQQQLGGAFDMEQAKRLGMPDSTLSGLIERAMLDQEAARLGLRAPVQSIRNEIMASPAFRNSLGQFDKFTFENAIRNEGYNETQFVNVMRGDMLRGQLFETLTGGASRAPETLVQTLYSYRQERRVAEFVELKDANAPPPATPDQAALEQFHKDNAARFSTPELREIAWIYLAPADYAKDVRIADQDIKDEYDARSSSYTMPELRTVEQAVYRSEEDAKAAKAMIDGGQDFAAAAEKTLNVKGADLSLGKLARNQLLPAISAPVFDLPVNKVSEPLRSPLGWHLVRVTAIEPGSTRSLADATAEIRAYLAERHAADRIVELGYKIEDKLASGASIAETGAAFNLPVARATVDARGRDAKGQPAALPPSQRFLTTAFSTQERNDPQVEDGGNGSAFVLRVEKIAPPALRPLDEVKAEVTAAWVAEQRAKGSEKQASDIADKLRAGGDMMALATAAKSKVETSSATTRQGEGADSRFAPALIAALFRAKTGETTVARSARNDGTIVARLTEIEPAAEPKDGDRQRDALAQSLAGGIAEDIYATYKAQLERRYSTTVDRAAADQAL